MFNPTGGLQSGGDVALEVVDAQGRRCPTDDARVDSNSPNRLNGSGIQQRQDRFHQLVPEYRTRHQLCRAADSFLFRGTFSSGPRGKDFDRRNSRSQLYRLNARHRSRNSVISEHELCVDGKAPSPFRFGFDQRPSRLAVLAYINRGKSVPNGGWATFMK